MTLSKTQIKEIVRLKENKYRTEKNIFLVEGVKMVNELLRSKYKVISICAVEEWINAKKLQNIHFPIYQIPGQDLKKISNLSTPNQVVAVVEIPSITPNLELVYKSLTLVLDEIKDPGNLGTIIRIADWFGIENIFCSHDTVDVYNPKVVQASMGSIFRVNIFYTDIEKILKERPSQLEVFGTVLDGNNIYTKKLERKGMIVIGNESQGISGKIRKLITQRLYIPRFSKGSGAESLNAAIATAIVCSEFRRNDHEFEK